MQSKRIVVATWGSLGDLHPYLAVALELKRRGHRILVASNAQYESKAVHLGLEFQALGPSVPSGRAGRHLIGAAMHPWRGSQWLFQNLLDPHARAGLDELHQACEGADFLLAHAIVLAAPLVARQKNIPWAGAALSPISFWSAHDATRVALPFGRVSSGSRLWRRVSPLLVRRATRAWFPRLDTLRRELGSETRSHPLFEAAFAGRATLALFSRQLGEPQPDWPTNTIQCGAPALLEAEPEHTGPEIEPWRTWAQAGQPPMVWTLGSTAVHIALGFWRHAFYAARALYGAMGRRSLFLVGSREYWRLPRPGTWGMVEEYAPFEQAFEGAPLVVHQGGVGTTQAAMRAGAAHLVVPWAQDQPDNAARIESRGLGLSLHRETFSSRRALEALLELERHSKYLRRTREVAALMEDDAASRAADGVESCL
jgi:UDP:flavonoid glycosyltransferase YjiC (YdhE family)